MKYCVFTTTMPDYTPEETIGLLQEIGYDGVEWRVTEPCPAEKPADYSFKLRYWKYNKSVIDIHRAVELAPEIRAQCDGAGLEMPVLGAYLPFCDWETAERMVLAADTLGCRKIRMSSPIPWNKNGESYRSAMAKAKAGLVEVEAFAKKHDIMFVFETHMDSLVQSPSAMYRFVCDCDPRYIGVIYDVGNSCIWEGHEDVEVGIQVLGEYLTHVHIKNGNWFFDKTENGTDLFYPWWTSLNKGILNLPRFMKLLRANGYDGYICIEDLTDEREPIEKLKFNLEYMKSCLE